MNILVTAGNTQVPIDQVRCITNIFSGRTGARIAVAALERGHHLTILTSHPEAISGPASRLPPAGERWRVLTYRTFDDLERLMSQEVQGGGHDAVIHCAAVSDYQVAGVFAPAAGTHFSPEAATWTGNPPTLADRSAGKIKSDEPEVWLRLLRAPKLVDKIRTTWAFRGVLVKFKLEVGIAEEQLLEIAERSRRHSNADLMVANTLEGYPHWAYLGSNKGAYQRVTRGELAQRLLASVEHTHEERTHG